MQKTDAKNEIMLTAAPQRLVLSLALPATAALLVSAGCGILEAWFIARLGTAAGGAIGIAFAVMALIQAIGYTLGTGAASLVSRALGCCLPTRSPAFSARRTPSARLHVPTCATSSLPPR